MIHLSIDIVFRNLRESINMLKVCLLVMLYLISSSLCGDDAVLSDKYNAFGYIKSSDYKSMRAYVLNGGNPNLIDNQGNSLLLLAVIKNDFPIFKLLLDSGAAPDFRNERGSPRERLVVMEQAAISENDGFLRALLEVGADPNTLDSYKKHGVLFQSIIATKIKNVKLLVSYGADVNALGPNEKTPIHTAISIKNYEIANYLLDSGADVTIKNRWGYSPVDTLKMFDDTGVRLDSENYIWYLKLLEKINVGSQLIPDNKNKSLKFYMF